MNQVNKVEKEVVVTLEIPQQLNELFENLNNLETSINLLSKKLSPILSTMKTESSDEETNRNSFHSEYGEKLYSDNLKVLYLDIVVRELLNDLQLQL